MSAPQIENIRNNVLQKMNYPVFSKGWKGLGQINWNTFSDGSPNNSFEDPEAIKGSDVFFIANFEDTNKIFQLFGTQYMPFPITAPNP